MKGRDSRKAAELVEARAEAHAQDREGWQGLPGGGPNGHLAVKPFKLNSTLQLRRPPPPESMSHARARIEQLLAEAAALEEAAAPAPDEAQAARLAGLRQQAAELQSAVGTAGLTVFRQLDADGSGKIDRDELCRALRKHAWLAWEPASVCNATVAPRAHHTQAVHE